MGCKDPTFHSPRSHSSGIVHFTFLNSLLCAADRHIVPGREEDVPRLPPPIPSFGTGRLGCSKCPSSRWGPSSDGAPEGGETVGARVVTEGAAPHTPQSPQQSSVGARRRFERSASLSGSCPSAAVSKHLSRNSRYVATPQYG